jgi:hypothetical protein
MNFKSVGSHLCIALLLAAANSVLTLAAAAGTTFDTETKLVPNVGARELLFGGDVAINQNTAAVGALLPPFNFHGGVYIYTLTGTNWAQTQILSESKGATVGDSFGTSIALDSDALVVGQPSTSVSNSTGETYIYTNSISGWIRQQVLVEPGGNGDGFGSVVDISAQTIAVGNSGESTGNPASGAVYIFQESGNTWLAQAKLKAPDSSADLRFGSSLALDGDTLLAGAVESVYVFVRTGTNWTQQQKLTNPVLPNGAFGLAVALEGNLAAVLGGKASNDNTSAVFVFTRTGSAWTFQQELDLGDNGSNSVFGASVAIHNGQIAVGVPDQTVDGAEFAGTVQVYEFNGTNWSLAQELAANDPQTSAVLGASVDFGAAGFIASAPGVVDVGRAGKGAAYIFSGKETNSPAGPQAVASPNVLWPPNHKMVPVTITISNHDNFDRCRIVSVSSNEPSKHGKKSQSDFVITGDLSLLLRAERAGNNKAGRIYTIEIQCVDGNGAIISTRVTVTVPHSKKK